MNEMKYTVNYCIMCIMHSKLINLLWIICVGIVVIIVIVNQIELSIVLVYI